MTPVPYRLLIAVLALLLARGGAALADQPAGAWYRGDLHTHSTYSDGDSGVAQLLEVAELRGLDFFALTDHDSKMGGVPRHWEDPAYHSARMVLLYGVEWTTGAGHANILAVGPFAYERLWLANRAQDAESAARIAHEEGAIFSINHPSADLCCPWQLDIPLSLDAVEVWNAPFRFPNKSHLAMRQFYEALLREGRRPTAIGGSDSHALRGFQARINQPGSPTTWVYAAERSPEGILAGIAAGHVSVSYSSTGDRLNLTADADGDGVFELMSGDAMAPGRPVTLKAQMHGASRLEQGALRNRAAWCVIERDGKLVKRALLRRTGDSVTFTDTPEAGTFYRAELRGTPQVGLLLWLIAGRTLALTNPIFVTAPE